MAKIKIPSGTRISASSRSASIPMDANASSQPETGLGSMFVQGAKIYSQITEAKDAQEIDAVRNFQSLANLELAQKVQFIQKNAEVGDPKYVEKVQNAVEEVYAPTNELYKSKDAITLLSAQKASMFSNASIKAMQFQAVSQAAKFTGEYEQARDADKTILMRNPDQLDSIIQNIIDITNDPKGSVRQLLGVDKSLEMQINDIEAVTAAAITGTMLTKSPEEAIKDIKSGRYDKNLSLEVSVSLIEKAEQLIKVNKAKETALRTETDRKFKKEQKIWLRNLSIKLNTGKNAKGEPVTQDDIMTDILTSNYATAFGPGSIDYTIRLIKVDALGKTNKAKEESLLEQSRIVLKMIDQGVDTRDKQSKPITVEKIREYIYSIEDISVFGAGGTKQLLEYLDNTTKNQKGVMGKLLNQTYQNIFSGRIGTKDATTQELLDHVKSLGLPPIGKSGSVEYFTDMILELEANNNKKTADEQTNILYAGIFKSPDEQGHTSREILNNEDLIMQIGSANIEKLINTLDKFEDFTEKPKLLIVKNFLERFKPSIQQNSIFNSDPTGAELFGAFRAEVDRQIEYAEANGIPFEDLFDDRKNNPNYLGTKLLGADSPYLRNQKKLIEDGVGVMGVGQRPEKLRGTAQPLTPKRTLPSIAEFMKKLRLRTQNKKPPSVLIDPEINEEPNSGLFVDQEFEPTSSKINEEPDSGLPVDQEFEPIDPEINKEPDESKLVPIKQLPAEIINTPAKEQIIKDEGGFVLKTYTDGVTKKDGTSAVQLTGGAGHKLTAKEMITYPLGAEIPMKVAQKWWKNDYAKAQKIASKFVPNNVPSKVLEIITNMAFMGEGSLNEFSGLKKAIKNKDYKKAAAHMEWTDPDDHSKGRTDYYMQTKSRAERLTKEMRAIK